MKNLLIILLATTTIFASCNCENNDNAEGTADSTQTVEALSVDEILESAKDQVDEEVVIEGTIAHVCKHGGKKMFLMGSDPDVRIKVTPNEEISAFERDLEGSDVLVTGLVREMRVDEAYLNNWEQEIAVELENATEETEHNINEGNPAHDGQHEDEEHANEDPYAQVKELRQQLADSGAEYLSFYSIECTKYELK